MDSNGMPLKSITKMAHNLKQRAAWSDSGARRTQRGAE